MSGSRCAASAAAVVFSFWLPVRAAPIRVEVVPIWANRSHVILDHEIALSPGEQRVWFEIRLTEGTGPARIRGYDIGVDLSGLKTASSASPTGAIQPCSADVECAGALGLGAYCAGLCAGGESPFAGCGRPADCNGAPCASLCFPGFVERERDDLVVNVPPVATGAFLRSTHWISFYAIAGNQDTPVVDTSVRNYVGTLAVDVPSGWSGRASLNLAWTNIERRSGPVANQEITQLGARLVLPCGTDADCADGDACTWDRCDPNTHACTHGPNHDPNAFCCDPRTGALAPLVDDPDDCVEVRCDRVTGVVESVTRLEGEYCGSPSNNPCDIYTHHCDAIGRCVAPAFVTNGTGCSDGIFCNGMEYCWNGRCTQGEDPCGDRTCDEGAGTCDGETPVAHLVESDPADGGEVVRVRDPAVRLIFDRAIVLPRWGTLSPYWSACGGFVADVPPIGELRKPPRYQVEKASDGVPRVLRLDDPSHWLYQGERYRIEHAGSWPGVAPFRIEFLVMRGDADRDGQVTFDDLVEVARHIPSLRPLDEASRSFDMNADGVVNSADLTAVNQYVPTAAPEPCPP